MSRRYKANRTISWSPDFAYCIGLLATDGCLSIDNRHIDFTSNDYQLVKTFRDIIRPNVKIGKKFNGRDMSAYRVQFGDVILYDYLIRIGLTPRKSKTIGKLLVPNQYYVDFLRGCFDGDGSSFGFWDRRWRSSFMYYLTLASASKPFLEWIQASNNKLLGVSSACIREPGNSRVYSLAYAKADSRKLFSAMYYSPDIPFLQRKYDKIVSFFKIDSSIDRG